MQILRIYILIINLITFIIRGRDKWKAVKQQRRVSERQLLRLSVLGGWLGALLGMQLFRHKTLKSSFLKKFWVIVIIRVCVLFYILKNSTIAV